MIPEAVHDVTPSRVFAGAYTNTKDSIYLGLLSLCELIALAQKLLFWANRQIAKCGILRGFRFLARQW